MPDLQHGHNPDVLSCLANLSSDEVFTPPEVANAMLDMLPESIWSDSKATFLDPACKSGVFLREIAKRLIKGLENEFPDLQKRLDHIFQKQLFGIAITGLTALLSRRSLYCSKLANGDYAISRFENEDGNIRFERTEHCFENGKCLYCGASQTEYDRGADLESHAYEFIHIQNPEILFNMKFDVIIGNPPYQLSDGGDTEERKRGGAIPLYQFFVTQAKKLLPKYLVMITPSRWFSGGRGLDEFRNIMISDRRMQKIVDYPISTECFHGVEIKGGISYFLWSRDYDGKCEVKNIKHNSISTMNRFLLESNCDVFIRYNDSVSILRKVLSRKEDTFNKIVSTQKPFGFRTYFTGEKLNFPGAIKIYSNKSYGFVKKNEITQHEEWVDKYKVYISMAYGAGEDFPHQIINRPFIGEPQTCCTETYIVIGPCSNKHEALNIISYISTKFFRFFVLLKKNTQHASNKVYSFVPLQDFSKPWTDAELYAKYDLTEEEIAFIESMIKPMDMDK